MNRMSDDLISRKALLKNLNDKIPNAINLDVFKTVIKEEPCVFDKEKVIKRLKSLKKVVKKLKDRELSNDGYFLYSGQEDAYEAAINEIKKGGLDE